MMSKTCYVCEKPVRTFTCNANAVAICHNCPDIDSLFDGSEDWTASMSADELERLEAWVSQHEVANKAEARRQPGKN